MRIHTLLYIWMPSLCLSASAQGIPEKRADSIGVLLPEVSVSESYAKRQQMRNTLQVEVADGEFLRRNFTGNLVRTLNNIAGVQSMDIGSGFSKPMIRGLGFNRISFIENGIKQEGQQWGADHGLEADPFNAEQIIVTKGPSSLLYGSDAMGGVIEVRDNVAPPANQLFGELSLLGKSVNSSLGGSLLAGIKKDAWS